MKCFYHSADLDGHASGAIVKFARPDCEMIGINYGDIFPFESINPDELVYMVDFTLQPFEQMERLDGICNLVWIDHHKTELEEAEKRKFDPNGIRRIGIGACFLVCEYFGMAEIPEAIRLLAEYDVWNHSDERTLPFQYGFRFFENTYPDNQELWESFILNDNRVNEVCLLGDSLLLFEMRQNQKYCRAYAFETTLENYTAICANKGMTSSKLFDTVYIPDKHDLMITFCRMKLPAHQWTVSLYSTKDNVDCGKIARKFGGGGHKGAAGFQCDELPFDC